MKVRSGVRSEGCLLAPDEVVCPIPSPAQLANTHNTKLVHRLSEKRKNIPGHNSYTAPTPCRTFVEIPPLSCGSMLRAFLGMWTWPQQVLGSLQTRS